MIIWLVGLSGAGKTTVGRALYDDLKKRNRATVFVDGDEIRALFKNDRPGDYTVEARRQNNDRIRALCLFLDRQGIDVVCCILSAFEDALARNRSEYSDYFEVYLKASVESLAARHPTDLYGRARRGEEQNVVGLDIPFPEPTDPDLILDNGTELLDVDEAVRTILTTITTRTHED